MLEILNSKKIYDIICARLEEYAGKNNVDRILNELELKDAKNENFLKIFSLIAPRYMTSTRIHKCMMEIIDGLKKLVSVEIRPKEIEMQMDEEATLRVFVTNNTGLAMKFIVTAEQTGSKISSFFYDAKRGYSLPSIEQSFPIENEKTHVFKFNLRTDLLEIKDLYEIKKKGEVEIPIDIYVQADHIDGFKLGPIKTKLKIVKIKKPEYQ
jgi:hypothetical protein